MTKYLENLPEDIYSLFKEENREKMKEVNWEELSNKLAATLKRRFEEDRKDSPDLRLSSVGTCARKQYLDKQKGPEELPGNLLLRFLFGDILEDVLLFLAKLSGHKVEDEQREVELGGVVGHLDATIDDIPTDIKTSAGFTSGKFFNESIFKGGTEDPYAYLDQISSYCQALKKDKGALWAVDLGHGGMKVLLVEDYIQEDMSERVKYLRAIIDGEEMPDREHEDIPQGKGGNKTLNKVCKYCRHKVDCWEGLRAFRYSDGVKYLTKVEKEPRVPEVDPTTHEVLDKEEE